MSEKFKADFHGTGSMKKFASETNGVFQAMNNITFKMPAGYAGIPPSAKVTADGLVFDFGDALIFTTKNVEWSGGTGTAEVVNGKLKITVT